jgi:hypothetical protein
MHWHYPLALAAPLGCLLALLGLRTVAGTIRVVSKIKDPARARAVGAVPQSPSASTQ